MRGFLTLLLLILSTALAQAQTAETQDDRGYLQALIEDNLSTADTQVRITGFNGSLFSKSTMDTLTIADTDGVWLTLSGVTLDWSRSALLSRKLEITELSAERIELKRLPPSGSTAPSAEATPFKLPELPLEVDIQKLSAKSVALGAAVLGTPAEFSVDGSASLSGGNGALDLRSKRIDGQTGTFNVAVAYSNSTDVLDLDVVLDEAPNGIVGTLLNLNGKPAVRLEVTGHAPLSQFAASINLTSDGVPRLSGQVRLSAAGEAQGDTPPARAFEATLSGDVAPLFAPSLAPFFGNSMALSVSGVRQPDGRTQIHTLTAETAAMQLHGQLDLGPGGLPERFDLTGKIADTTGALVTLPLPGPPTTLTGADISAQFDAARGDAWRATAMVRDFRRGGLSVGIGSVDATGTISDQGAGQVTANIGIAARDLSHDDPALASAMGSQLSAGMVLDWTAGVPLQVRDLKLDGAGLALRAAGRLDTLSSGLTASGTADLKAASIARFAGLLGRDVSGGIDLHAEGSGALLGGAFDLSLTASATDLVTATPRLDPLLKGASRVALVAKRDETGTELKTLTITSHAIDARASGAVSSTAGQLDLDASIRDLSLVDAGLSGPGTAQTKVSWQQGQPVQFTRLHLTGAGAEINASGSLDPDRKTLPARGKATLNIADLSVFRHLTGKPLSGALQAALQGSGEIRGSDFDLDLTATGTELGIGQAEVDRLVAGDSSVSAKIARKAGQYLVDHLELKTPELSVQAKSKAGPGSPLKFQSRLADVGLFAADFSGPAELSGQASPAGQDWAVEMSGTGPGGTTTRISGRVAGDLGSVDLTLTGSAPLGLANPFIAPRSLQGTLRYDLQLKGAPSLENLSGQLSTAGARFSAPRLKTVLTDIGGTVTLSGGTAQIALTANGLDGGGLRIAGPVGLQKPFSADLSVTLSDLVVSDPALYRTSVSGTIAVSGPLTSGGKISGTLDLGDTEVQVTTSAANTGDIPDGLTHIHESAASRRSRARAGLVTEAGAGASGGGTVFGLDVLVRAPNRIFIRGRGLDAEFGGRLRLTSTTEAVIPIGQFDLIRGRLDLLGKRFTLTEGSISIQGSLDPYMRLVAETQTTDITARIILQGLISAPEVTFESDPSLPQDEVVAQLLFGRDMSTLSPFQAIQLAGAVATLTGHGGGGVVSNIRSTVGLDDLDVSSTAEGDTQVRAGKYLSDKLYSDITVDSAGKSEVNLNYDINSKLKVKGRLASDGNTGIGLFYQKDY